MCRKSTHAEAGPRRRREHCGLRSPPDCHERRRAHSARWPRLLRRRWVGAASSHRGRTAHLWPDRCRAHCRHLRCEGTIASSSGSWQAAGKAKTGLFVDLERRRPHWPRTRLGQRNSSATRPRRSPSGTTSTAGSWCRTTAPRRSGLLLGLSPPTIPPSGPESPRLTSSGNRGGSGRPERDVCIKSGMNGTRLRDWLK